MNKAEEFLKGLNPHSLVFELSIDPEYTEKQLLMFAEMYHKSEVKKLNIDDVSKPFTTGCMVEGCEERQFSLNYCKHHFLTED